MKTDQEGLLLGSRPNQHTNKLAWIQHNNEEKRGLISKCILTLHDSEWYGVNTPWTIPTIQPWRQNRAPLELRHHAPEAVELTGIKEKHQFLAPLKLFYPNPSSILVTTQQLLEIKQLTSRIWNQTEMAIKESQTAKHWGFRFPTTQATWWYRQFDKDKDSPTCKLKFEVCSNGGLSFGVGWRNGGEEVRKVEGGVCWKGEIVVKIMERVNDGEDGNL